MKISNISNMSKHKKSEILGKKNAMLVSDKQLQINETFFINKIRFPGMKMRPEKLENG